MSWLAIIGMACITFSNRFAFLVQRLAYQPGDSLKRFLSFSSLAVLTAIWVPIVFNFSFEGGVGLAGWDYLLAAVVAASMSLLRLHSLLVVLVSTCVFFFIRFFS